MTSEFTQTVFMRSRAIHGLIRGIFCMILLTQTVQIQAQPVRTEDPDHALATVRAEEDRRIAVFEQAAKAVVCIFEERDRSGGGSGVLFDPEGYGLTNFHVVQPFIESRHGYGALADGKLYPLTVLGIDPGGDIVMFKLAGKERFDYAELGDSDRLRVGQSVAAMGNPFLLAEDYQPTISFGVISGLHRYQEGQGNLLEYADCIQVSTSINPGNSGGPLFDLAGRVIGVNGRASFEERGRVNVGLGYAISINQIKRFMPGLRAGRLMEHGTLGATVRTAGDDLIVGGVQDFSPAERAGIKLGDAVIGVAGRSVHTPNDYNNVLAVLPANWPVTVRLVSGGQIREIAARLDRLSSRLPLYIQDMGQNREELRKIWMNAPLVRAAARHDSETRLRIAGHAIVAEDEIPFVVTLAPAAPEQCDFESAAADAVTIEPAAQEWIVAVAPLLGAPRFDDRWVFLGGDEVDGRIVNVIEYRPDAENRTRWKFDWQTGVLRQIALGAGEQQETAFWNPQVDGSTAHSEHASSNESTMAEAWPTTWTRIEENASSIVLHVEPPRAAMQATPSPSNTSEGGDKK